MITRLQLSFISTAKPCYQYNNLSDASRNRINVKTLGQALCDNELLEGWYRFVGAAGTKMPTTRVPRNRCGTQFSGWLNGIHPTVEDGEVYRTVCFSKLYDGCKYSNEISVDHTSSTSFSSFHPIVNYVIVVQTEWNNAMTEQLIHKSICVHMYFKRIKIVYSLSKSLKRCTND